MLTTCPDDQTCKKNGDLYICNTTGPDDETDQEDFICPGEGAFPDQKHSGTGYLCKGKDVLPEMICECPEGMALKTNPFSCTAGTKIMGNY